MPESVFGEPAWFSGSGPDDDVVISTRVRLARNLAGLPFPQRMSEKDRQELRVRIVPLLADVAPKPAFRHIDIQSARPEERTYLVERNILPRDLMHDQPLLLCVRNDQRVTVIVNGIDHIQVTGLRTGMQPQSVLSDVRSLEEQLDESLRFAVDMNFGYLTSDITSCGTGMRCGTLVHVPALTETGQLRSTLAQVQESGFRVKRFASTTEKSLGSVYQVSDEGHYGKSEETAIRELEAVTGELVQAERENREILMERPDSEFCTRIHEARRNVETVTSLETEEALRTVLWLRVGAATGMIEGMRADQFTPLLFEVQKNHILRVIAAEGGATGTRGDRSGITDSMVAAHRAELVRRLL
ncbi:MAG: hypothetical protein ACLFNQ_02140 [Spirochaetaceae bacterium]